MTDERVFERRFVFSFNKDKLKKRQFKNGLTCITEEITDESLREEILFFDPREASLYL